MLKYILISFLFITNVYAYTCEEMGYTKTIADCPEGGLKCPAQPEKMFCCDPCGNTGVFRFNEDNCLPDDGLQLAGFKCGGRWSECRECTSQYKYNKDNCRKPKVLAGVQCGNAYTHCEYPVGGACIPTVGYIYYADGSCHANYDASKEAIGVIVDASKKIILSLDEKTTSWNDGTSSKDIPDLTNYSTKVEALFDMDGKSNTDKIISFALTSGQGHPAAEYCANKTDGNKKWYLPAIGELYIIYNNLTNIQDSLNKITSATKITPTKFYLSSTERNSGHNIWILRFSDGYNGGVGPKTDKTDTARCFAYF